MREKVKNGNSATIHIKPNRWLLMWRFVSFRMGFGTIPKMPGLAL